MENNWDDINQALDEILKHEIFASSTKSKAFLTYIINEYQLGRKNQLNETTIAQDVFNKGIEFNPAKDSSIRVAAGRIRKMLDLYYAENLPETRVKISIPRGHYHPAFEYIDKTEELDIKSPHLSITKTQIKSPRARKKNSHSTKAFSILFASISILLFLFWPKTPRNNVRNSATLTIADKAIDQNAISPQVGVALFDNQTGHENYDFLENTLQQKTAEDLSRFTYFEAVAIDNSLEAALSDTESSYPFVMTAIILSVDPEVDLFFKLHDKNNGGVIYEKRVTRSKDTSDYVEFLSEIIGEISATAQAAITEDRLKKTKEEIKAGTIELYEIGVFECMVLSNTALSDRDPISYKNGYLCLESLLENPRPSEEASLLTHFGALTFVGARNKALTARSFNPDINVADGIDMMQRAALLDPNNPTAHYFLSQSYNVLGMKKEALRHAELGHIANPASNGILTVWSNRLAANDEWEKAIYAADKALERNPKPRGHYYLTSFAWALLSDDKGELINIANKVSDTKYYYADVFQFLAAVANDDQTTTEKLRPNVIKLSTENFDVEYKDTHSIIHFMSLHGHEEIYAIVHDLFLKGGISIEDGVVMPEML